MPGGSGSNRQKHVVLAAALILVAPLLANVFTDPGRLVNGFWLSALVCTLPALASVACFARASSSTADRLAWRLIGTGIGFWAAGAIGRFLLLDVSDGRSVPAWVDPLFLLMYPLVLTGLILVLRNRLRTSRHLAYYDSITGFILLIALCFTFFPDQVTRLTGYDNLGSAVLITYPLGDIALLILTACLFRFASHLHEGPWPAFGSGLALFAVADLCFALQTPTGGRSLGLLSLFWMVGFVLMIYGTWQPDGEVIEVTPGTGQLLLPLVFLSLVVGALAYGQEHDLWEATVVALSIAFVLVLLRLGVTTYEYTRAIRESERHRLDGITRLPARTRLTGWLDQHAKLPQPQRPPLFVLAIVIERIGQIEAALGPDALDEMISITATRIRRSVGEIGQLAAIDRGQFGLLCAEDSAPDPESVARLVFQGLERPVEVGGIRLQCSAVIGAGRYPEDTRDPGELLRLALISCDEARSSDTALQLTPREPDRARKSLKRTQELRDAIGRGQLTLHYQPKVRTDDKSVHAVEALVRWQHPSEGVLPPLEFIDLAEEGGFASALTDEVIDLGARQQRAWKERGIDLNVGINLAMSDLIDESLVRRMSSAVNRHGVDPADMTLEISENLVMTRPTLLISNLKLVKETGFRISLDDFGSGTTSLAHLRSLPVDEIKIDRPLVARMHQSREDAVIGEAAISIARELGLDVVAEGAEEERTVARLERVKCSEIQSYYYSRPLPADQFEIWLAEYESGLA